ncbi:hypothetical protein T8K17_25230 [Thalassobaculum sp. OXR-137]|nr:hypothetical protein [Thalassobaculum sp. OXR-137]WPZ34514.1 hypothetical protein T8K17_25230 [Thalassobaculum sp. OXR-137]
MFTKKIPVDRGSVNIQRVGYKTVVDWEAIGGALALLFILFIVIGAIGGS